MAWLDQDNVTVLLLFIIAVATAGFSASEVGLIGSQQDRIALGDKNISSIQQDVDSIEDRQEALLDKGTFNSQLNAQQQTFESLDGNTDNIDSTLTESRTMFGGIATATRNLEIDLVSDQGTSVLRDVKDLNGSASVPQQPAPSGEIIVQTGTTSQSHATLETATLGRYSPGQQAQMGIGIRQLEIPEGDQYWEAGYYDGDDGYVYGRNSTCLYVKSYSNGQEEKSVCRENWNGQDIDNQLGRSWNMSDGAILQIDYSWYGYGAVRFSIVDTNNQSIEDASPLNRQNTVPVHTFTPEGETSMTDPIQPIRVDVYNGNSNENVELRVGGRQFSVFGDMSKVNRISNDGVTQQTVDTTNYECLISFTKESTESAANTEAKFYGIQAITSGALTEVAVLYNAELAGTGTYTRLQNTPDEESSLLSNRNCELADVTGESVAYAQPNGTELWNQFVSGSGTGQSSSPGSSTVNGLNAKIPPERNVVVVARSVSGTSTDVTTNVKLLERK